MAVPVQDLPTYNSPAPPHRQSQRLRVCDDWFEHPKVRLAFQRSDGSAASTLYELREILEETERCWDELLRRGSELDFAALLGKIGSIAAGQAYGTDSLEEVSDLLRNGFTQAELNRMFGWADGTPVRRAARALGPPQRPHTASKEQVIETYISGLSVHDTAAALHTSGKWVRQVVRAAGLPRHPPYRPEPALPPAA